MQNSAISVTYHISHPEGKVYMIILIDIVIQGKKIQHPFMIWTLNKVGIERNFLYLTEIQKLQ